MYTKTDIFSQFLPIQWLDQVSMYTGKPSDQGASARRSPTQSPPPTSRAANAMPRPNAMARTLRHPVLCAVPRALRPSDAGHNARMSEVRACRPGCAACCIAPSISSPSPAHPHGKPAGVACGHLDADWRCTLFAQAQRPAVCSALQASEAMCGDSREHALRFLQSLEEATQPTPPATPRVTQARQA